MEAKWEEKRRSSRSGEIYATFKEASTSDEKFHDLLTLSTT